MLGNRREEAGRVAAAAFLETSVQTDGGDEWRKLETQDWIAFMKEVLLHRQDGKQDTRKQQQNADANQDTGNQGTSAETKTSWTAFKGPVDAKTYEDFVLEIQSIFAADLSTTEAEKYIIKERVQNFVLTVNCSEEIGHFYALVNTCLDAWDRTHARVLLHEFSTKF